MKALVIGATGATGKDVLELLLKDDSVDQVDIFVRRPTDVENPKLKVHIINLDKPEEWSHLVLGDVLFSCLGTTLKAAGSKEAQWKIDHSYQFDFAKAARQNQVPALILVSAFKASPGSKFFYSRLKGRLEEDIKSLHFPRLVIFKPSILLRKDSDRKGERMIVPIIKFMNSIGILRKHKPLDTQTLAEAMVSSAKDYGNGISDVEGQEIRRYGKNEAAIQKN